MRIKEKVIQILFIIQKRSCNVCKMTRLADSQASGKVLNADTRYAVSVIWGS